MDQCLVSTTLHPSQTAAGVDENKAVALESSSGGAGTSGMTNVSKGSVEDLTEDHLCTKKSPLELFKPLIIPPKIVGSLTSDKSLRDMLKKYSLQTDGKKNELIERYNKFRLEVQTANDREEKVTYARIAQRVSAQEKQRAAMSLLRSSTQVNKIGGDLISGVKKSTGADFVGADGLPIILTGSSFKELIAVTKARDAARRAARANNEEKRNMEQQSDDNHMKREGAELVLNAGTQPHTISDKGEHIETIAEKKRRVLSELGLETGSYDDDDDEW